VLEKTNLSSNDTSETPKDIACGGCVGFFLLDLEEQDRQASVNNDLCILSCLPARYGLASSCLFFNGSLHTQAVWSLSWILLGIYVSLSCPFFWRFLLPWGIISASYNFVSSWISG